MKDANHTQSPAPIPVIDLFAGPGGLNEGFSSVGEDTDNPVFQMVGSFEMERNAVATLTLRSTFRILKRAGRVPQAYYDYVSGKISKDDFEQDRAVVDALASAKAHVHQIELGAKTRDEVDKKIASALSGALKEEGSDWVLIGGPPCQAYSLAGRSRRTNDEKFALDPKHFLYEEYLRIIKQFRPAVFVMENVKGLLSSTNTGVGMFNQILRDLRHPDPLHLKYEIRSLVVDEVAEDLLPRDFVIPAEKYGIPQKRHRIILLGIRSDVVERTDRVVLTETKPVTVRDAIGDLPSRRSRISPLAHDSDEAWDQLRSDVRSQVSTSRGTDNVMAEPETDGDAVDGDGGEAVVRYRKWIEDPRIRSTVHHESRSHMTSDIKRYGHLAAKAIELGKTPKFTDLPDDLVPNHENIKNDVTPFMDRFRVQVWDAPSSTVVSHISKDGHYYIHPDETQMRSLTVREAARLQTFPDNYFFEGSRTAQFHQVGNAVPPLLALLIAEKVVETLRLTKNNDDSKD
ncbi:DNA cytosine methyltransferase [Arthrobacter glacialis]|uniref:DNA cytosine methyltransferase n=1 Tax=Arthrobacter glacialis TaxID=1664 RepID=UPI000CD41549|nr:DNA cytosine methyltransferase [Arthrobacter glacialis]POH60161.1 DNA (cytosine-5-)-methyltransferase [Arthrobacter glacialis]